MVNRKRHIAKALTWRIIASVVTVCLAMLFGLPQKTAGIFFIIDMSSKFILYYLHERAWYNFSKYGIKE